MNEREIYASHGFELPGLAGRDHRLRLGLACILDVSDAELVDRHARAVLTNHSDELTCLALGAELQVHSAPIKVAGAVERALDLSARSGGLAIFGGMSRRRP